MEHIFGEQYELGMDYLQILYEKPAQPTNPVGEGLAR
jgi:hypothetical protein